MASIYLGRWEWFDTGEGLQWWQAPGGDNIGTLDLRSHSQKSLAGGQPQGFGIFSYDVPRTHPLLVRDLGSELDEPVGPATRQFLENRLGALPPLVNTPREIIRYWLTQGDPRGQNLRKPVRGNSRHRWEVFLGGFGKIVDQDHNEGHPGFQNTINVFRADYRRKRLRNEPLAHLRRFTGDRMQKLWGERSDSRSRELLPAEYQDDGWDHPQTSFGDTFDRTNQTDLNQKDDGKTKNGAAGTWSWTEVAGDSRIDTNSWRPEDNTTTFNFARCEDDLSSDDHLSYITMDRIADSSFVRIGAVARFDSSANDNYFTQGQWTTSSGWILQETNTGTRTNLGSLQSDTPADNDKVEIQCDGSTIRLIINDSELTTATDSTHTGHTRAGVAGYQGGNTSADNCSALDWWSEDVSTGLTVSVSETPSVAEDVQRSLTTVRITVNENEPVTTTEDVQRSLDTVLLKVSESETITVTEFSKSVLNPVAVRVNEAITAAENLRIGLNLGIRPSEALTLLEDVQTTIAETGYFINVFDSVTTSENVKAVITPLTAIVNEAVTALENLRIGLNLGVRPADAVTVAESTSLDLATGGTIDKQVAASSDDADQFGTTVDITNANIRTNNIGSPYTGAIRFLGVTIPDGSTITTAYFEPYVYNATVDSPDIDIYAEDNSNPATFAATSNNISDRTKTTATVNWSADDLAIGQFQQSPSIVSIIQELVDSYDYSSGAPIVLILESDGDNDSAFWFRAYDTGSSVAAKLHIEYTGGVAGLEISASDAISIAEDIQKQLNVVRLKINEAETLSIAEATTQPLSPILAAVQEALTVLENVNAVLQLGLRPSEAVTVIEDLQAQLATVRLKINEAESIAVTEGVTAAISPLLAIVSDAVTVAEQVTPQLNFVAGVTVNVSDSITAVEFVQAVLTPILVNASDSITAAEFVKAVITPFVVRVSEGMTVTEAASATLGAVAVSEFESLTVAEFRKLVLHLGTVQSESVTVQEFSKAVVTPLVVAVAEGLGVVDYTTQVLSGPLSISEFEAITVSELFQTSGITADLRAALSLTDALTTNLAVSDALATSLSVSDALATNLTISDEVL